jgi:hypothetical protein
MPAAPIAHGFRSVARRPGLTLVEFVWRAAFLASAALLCFAAFAWFVQGVRVSDSDAMALRSGIWLFILDAVVRVLSENYQPLVRALFVLLPALALLWMFAAALGRGALLRSLLPAPGRRWLAPLLGLGLLRVALGLAALAAFYGCGVLAWEAARTPDDVLPQTFVRVFVVLVLVVWLLWSMLSWFLWLASIPAAAGSDTFSAIAAAVHLWRANGSHFLRAGLLFSALRLLLLLLAAGLAAAILLPATAETRQVAAALVFFLLLGNMLAAAWLRAARLAAFTALYEPAAEASSGRGAGGK